MRRALLPLFLFGCATTTPPEGPRGMRATDHLEAAREHSEAASQRDRWPDPRRDPSATPGDPAVAAIPWFYYWQVREDERLAEMHRSSAAQIEADYETACGDRPVSEVSVSPLVRFALGASPVADGAIVYMSTDAGSPGAVLAAMRCHRAWMMLGRSAMDDCPLDLPSIDVTARAVAGAVEVTITTPDAAGVPELQRRVAKDVEIAASNTLRSGPR